ncbi:MAG: hypothetical protein HUK22_04125, partial [Thermoguttaceae bacterium]|nr:hypothetical protein [Thermoguttaceae bacterium]
MQRYFRIFALVSILLFTVSAFAQRPGGARPGGAGGGRPDAAPTVAPPKLRASLDAAQLADLQGLRQECVKLGLAYLTKAQQENGSFSASPRAGIGPTLIVALGLLRSGVPLDAPVLEKTLKFLEASIQPDGGVYSTGGHLSSYESCLGLVCFALADEAAGDARYAKVVQNAEKFVRSTQYNA